MPSYTKPNSGRHILDIIFRTICMKHNAPKGVPCFKIHYHNGKGKYGPAICGTRVIKAGFNGKIHPNSLGQRISAGESRFNR